MKAPINPTAVKSNKTQVVFKRCQLEKDIESIPVVMAITKSAIVIAIMT
jgi:hypothetical protein